MTRCDKRSSSALLAVGAALVVTAVSTGTAMAYDDLPPSTGVVQAYSLGAAAPISRPPATDGPALRPNHPPIALIPPIPMPEPMVGPRGPRSNTMLYHDSRTGETIEIPYPPASGAPGGSGGGYNGADGGGGWEVGDPLGGFSDLILIQNPEHPPWRMNCKLVMRFVDQNNSSVYFVGSGSMIDAETVITAGHCVYVRHVNGGTDVFDWARDIWVYPGWDGSGYYEDPPPPTLPPNTVGNFGVAEGPFQVAGSDWVNYGDYDEDCGLIMLTRGVGMLTGWYGWSWGQDCGWIQSRTFNNASFPAEECDAAQGLHNGEDMYYWWGTIDLCYANQMRVHTGDGCFDAAWGGSSGSGVYWNDNGVRRIHAISSTADHETYWDSARLYESFVTLMNEWFIPVARGDDFDLQALDVNAEPHDVDTGSQLTLANFLAINPTNASASGTWTYRVYLSSDAYISDQDTLLSTQSFDYDFAPMSSVRVNMALPTIPEDTPLGPYRLGVILDPATDVDDSNNDTDGWDAAELWVYELCAVPPNFSLDIDPSDEWSTVRGYYILPEDGCSVARVYMYPGYDYDFSVCDDDGVGGYADPGDGDLRMYDGAGNELWHIDGHIDCDYDASTLGTVYEGWSPPAPGYYYLEVSDFFGDPMTFDLAYKYTDASHCYAPPVFDHELSLGSNWQTTSEHTIDAPGGCRFYRMYLASSLGYDFSVCASDGVFGWANPGNGDFEMLDSAGNTMWTIDGEPACGFDATTIGSPFEGWSPPSNGYYYLRVTEHDDEAMAYKIAYRIAPGPPPPNDDCGDVSPVPLAPGDPVLFYGVNVGATIDSDLSYPEVWHAFTTTECVDLTLSYCTTTPHHSSVYILLKDTCPAFGPSLIASNWDNELCGDGNLTISWDALPPGTYWYPVLSRPGSEGPYVIEATALTCGGCSADVNGSGDVDFQDLLVLLSEWGPCIECDADIDGNDWVDFQDLLILLAAWGSC